MDEPVRAKDVQVAHIYQARCRRQGCEWSSELTGSYQEANVDRQAHLDDHRERPGMVYAYRADGEGWVEAPGA